LSIRFGHAVLCLPALCAGLVFSQAAAAQDPPVNTSLRGQWDGFTGSYADVWADGNFAYVGHFGSAGVEILDISDPTNIVSVGPYILPAVHAGASTQDVKVADGLLFVGLEVSTNAGVHIVDVRDPTNPVPLVDVAIPDFNQVHNVFYDQGFLYFADSSTTRVGIVDLRTLDPDNPPTENITTTKWVISNIGTPLRHEQALVHDITVQNGLLYVAAWDNGLWVYAVDQLATSPPVKLGDVAGNNTHSCWPTADGKFVVTAEERAGGGIQVFEVAGSNPTDFTLTLRDSRELTITGQAFSVHNPVVDGNRVYCSWYQAGLQVFDIDPFTGSLSLVASFDTTPLANSGGFAGNWGVYPLLGADRVCLSDLSEGLFVVDVSSAVIIDFPNGLPDAVTPGEATDIDVTVIGLSDTLVPGSSMFHYRFDGGSFMTTPLVPVGGNLFRATLPAASCMDTPSFYFTAEGEASGPVSEPGNAPTSTFKSAVGAFTLVELLDNFETDLGWTVSGDATAGRWERGIPAGGGRGNPDDDADGSGQAYVTGNHVGSSDVDGGSTVLTSPPYTVAAGQWISYAFWLNSAMDIAPSTVPDTLTVEVATDAAGTNWQVVRTYRVAAPNWRTDRIEIGNEVLAMTTLRLRFTATDAGSNTTIEAGLDDVRIVEVQCGGPPDCTILGDDDLDGVCNDADACPTTAGNDPVDENGCSTADDDGDGVPNDADACNATPTCATAIGGDGCEGDDDGDGVADGCDLCPGTALNDPVDGAGCSTAADAGGGDSLFSFESCPDDVIIPATSDAGVAFHVAIPSVPPVINAAGAVGIVVDPALGTVFPVGTTTVTLTAIDDSSKSVTCHFNVTVLAPGAVGDPVGLAIENTDCGCGNGAGGMMMMPMLWIGVRQVRRRRGMRTTRGRR
jgi:hypothetical protein